MWDNKSEFKDNSRDINVTFNVSIMFRDDLPQREHVGRMAVGDEVSPMVTDKDVFDRTITIQERNQHRAPSVSMITSHLKKTNYCLCLTNWTTEVQVNGVSIQPLCLPLEINMTKRESMYLTCVIVR